MSASIEPLLLTPEEAGECLRLSRSTIYDLMDVGKLLSVKVGRARRIPAEAVRDYVRRLMEEAA